MKLHRPVLKLRRLKSQRAAEESNIAPLESEEEPVTPAERLEKVRAQAAAPLWMGRNDLDAAGCEDTQPSQVAELSELTSPETQSIWQKSTRQKKYPCRHPKLFCNYREVTT